MDFNTLLTRFGLDSLNFVDKPISVIETEDGFVYEIEESHKKRLCPYCNHSHLYIHDYNWININLCSSIGVKEILRIKRIRYKCPFCHKSFTHKLEGLNKGNSLSTFTINEIKKEFHLLQSFSNIANRYKVSVQTIINIFDQYTKIMPRRTLPMYLCIDEKHFEGDTDGKYCVVISDFFSGEVVDILPNRQMAYLNEYFSNIPFKERNNVKVFISDMYEGYSTVKNKYFPSATFVIDLFHVIKALSTTVNQLRIRTYNLYIPENTIEKHFMKSNWKIFLKDFYKIKGNEYHSKKYNLYIHYGELIMRCLKYNQVFWDGYEILQELLHYDKYTTYTEAEKFVKRIIGKLNASGDELLIKTASTYNKWLVGIANGLAKNQTGKRYSNAIAENNNSHIQRVINVSYGYGNFKRFRAKVMLNLSYKKI